MLDSEFSGQVLRLMSTVSKTEATQIIHMATVEAFHALHFTKSITHFTHEVSANACMMVSILTQWLIRHLCKRVMQLMTSEALCMDHRKIPTSYIQAYLNHQHHFSLKELLECQANKLTDKKMCAASKLVCFMRSSTTLHQLPAQFPTPIHQLSSDAEDTSLLQELVFTKTKELVVHKMSSITTFSSINELLKSFVSSKTQRVLLVVINMEDTNKELVNHLRIMIEEAESRCASQNKLFALLLHFQTCRLASPCYPIMFLPGWDFTYLEMIGYSPRGGVLDIRDWFRQCYGSSSGPDHSIAPHLSALLREAIPAICSRISFKKQPGSTFNCDMKILERNRALEQLFFNKGVGEVLCERFNSYWTSSVMVEYLEKAALHAQQHESPNVIDNLQTNFKSLFVDFLVYMVFDMNRGMNIDVLFDPDCNRETTKLFLDILRIVPIPKLPEITMTCVANDTLSLREEKEVLFPPKFPFFSKVCAAIEKLVDQTRRDLIQNVDVLDDQTEGLLSVLQSSEQARAQTMSSMFKTLQSKLSDVSQGEDKTFLSVGVEGLLSADSLWQKYLQDFSQQKLHLEFESSGICGKVCSAAFGKLENRSPIQRLAILHVYVHIHKLNLAKVVSILRPLDQVEDAVLTLTSMIVNPSSQSLLDVEDGSDLLGCSEALSGFIINTLFNAIAAISMTLFAQGNRDLKDWEVEQVKVWFRAYRDVMSMHALKEHIYVSRSTTSEAQHSAMHALFLILRSKPLGDLETLKQGLHVFNKLFCRFFTTRFDLQGPAPRLEHIVSYTLEGLSLFLPAHLPQARRILEGLLIHFFCRYRTLYNTEDVVWFLELTNKQSKWQASYIMDQVNQFTYSEDVTSVLDLEEDGSSKELSVENIATDMPMALFKFLLRRIILSSVRKTEDPINSVLLFFNKAEAHKLITKVLCSNQDLGKAGPFIPTYYQLCDYSISPPPSAENKLMQQPLAHLYFLTVMEDLLDSNYALSGLIKTTHNISKCEHWFEGHECNCCDDQCPDGSSSGCQLVLLHIEEQAIVQVIIKETARLLDQKDSSKINALFAVLPDLNAILDDEWMGGGKIGGHGLTLVMHLLREKKSFNNFLQTLTTDYSLLSDGINCLEPFHRALPEVVPVTASVSVSKSEANFMPYQDMGTDVQLLYSKVVGCMNAIHTSHGSSAKSREREFVRLSEEYSTGDMNVTTPSGVPAAMNKLACFRMTLWLATYNEFFIKKRQSKTLAQIVAGLSKRIGSQCSQLVQCFLDPDLLNRGSFVTSMKSVSGQGPTFSLFSSTTQDHASSDLQRALVHLITAILASRPNNTNLWYLLLNAEQVTGSYIPGFMYDTPIGPDTKFYNNGVDFTEDGFYACAGAIKHVTRGTLSLHSLYSLLWANFSSFSMALLTQPDVADKLSGNIFSSGECVQERCTSRMVKLWGLMQSVLCVSEEERLLLVTDCLNRFMEQQMMRSPDLRGKISAKVDLDLYEKNWHEKIFSPAWSSLRVGFARSRSFLNMPVIRDVIKLDSRYPWTPGVKSLTNTILSSVNIGDPTDQLYPLSQFVVEYPRLRTGMELLPSILELYQWLHTELTYAVSYEQATSITLGRLSKVLTRHSMLSGIGKLKEIFNNYVQLTGCTSHMRPVTLGDDTPLLHLLSCSSDHSSDLLFTVLQDVIMFLNQFFETLLAVTKDSVVMESLFPTSSPKVPVMEFVHHYMIVARTGSCSDLLQLIHSRTLFPPAYPTEMGSDYQLSNSSLPGQLSKLIDLLPLQDDILTLSVVGMPLIDPVSIASLRMPFKFKEDCSSLHHLKLQDYAVDLEEIATKLPEHFKRPLDDTYKKRLEYEFHSAGCHTVLEIVAGLRTAMGHLVKSVSGGEELQEEVTRLPFQKLPAYLVSLYEYDPQDSTTDVFHEIGINSLSQAQRGCLDSLSLDNLFHARKLFVSWAEDGFYDFCSLPFGVKKLMSVPDEDFLMHLPDNFQGSPADLLKKLRSLVDILVHLESSIVKAASTTPQKAIVRFLKKLIVCNNMDALQDMIPETVKLENYVTLRLALRRLTTQVQATVSRSALVTPEPKEEKWNDFIQDFWEDRLPHFRRRGYVYASSSTHPYFSNSVETPESSSKILDELIGSSSETNLLKEFSEEDLNVESSTTAAGPPLTDNEPVVEETCVTLPPEKPAISDEELQTIAKDVSVQQVVGFLQSVELDQYATTFEESDINGELLVQFQDEELKEMEITSALDRLKVVVFFKRFLLKSRNLTSDVLSPEGVSKILNDNRQLRHYAKTFLEKGVDGELLMSANDEVMRELGVEKGAHRLMIRNKFNVLVK